MKVSIITVCLNSEKTVEDTIQSVSQQTHQNVEHIVVDGDSMDGTLEILYRYHNQLSKLVSEPDSGIYDAMNKGLLLASGDIICFLNADDAYSHSGVLALIERTMKSENLDALYGDVAFFHTDHPHQVVRRYRSARFRPSRIAWGWMPAHPALFLHRRVFDRIGLFKTDYQIAGDFEFIARAFHSGALRYHYQPEVLVHMRTGGASTAGVRNTLLLNREVLRACRENGIYTNPLMILSKYPYKLVEFFLP